jgi:sigma-B regulation protein RsbQ
VHWSRFQAPGHELTRRARNNVEVLGRGSRPMLFGHGFGCDQTMWR